MRVDQAKSISLALILEKMGYQPIETKAHEILYPSPFSKRERDRLKVLPHLNIWIDEGIDKRGDTISLIVTWQQQKGQPHTVDNALYRIAELMGIPAPMLCIPNENDIPEEQGSVVESNFEITHRGLINFLENKGVPQKVANRYLKPVRVLQPGKKKSFLALGLKNEDNGIEIYNPYYRAYKGARNIYFVRGSSPVQRRLHIFKDIFDFLSYLVRNEGWLEDDAIIIHSYSLMPMAAAYITAPGYEVISTWMPSDEAGRQAARSFDAFLKTEPGLTHAAMDNTCLQHESISVS